MSGNDGHTCTKARYTARKRGGSLVPIEYNTTLFSIISGTLQRAKVLGESNAMVTCVPVNLRTRNAATIPLLYFSLSTCGHPQSRDRSRRAHELRTRNSPAMCGVIPIDRLLGTIDWRSSWHRLGSTDAHALRQQDAWHGALHSEKP